MTPNTVDDSMKSLSDEVWRAVTLPPEGAGEGLVEAARGAPGHRIEVSNGKISSYQIVAPIPWNVSPRNAQGLPGPVDAALAGAPVGDGENAPLSGRHIGRGFGPCMVCTVH